MEYAPLVRSANITDAIILKIKNRLPKNTKFMAFNADCFDPQVAIFRNVFLKHNIPFAEEPARLVLFSGQKGNCTFAADGYHWNELGHELIAKGLVPEIRGIVFENK